MSSFEVGCGVGAAGRRGVSFWVFLYFRPDGHAERVLERMRAKAKRVVAVLDVPDRTKHAEAIAYRQRPTPREPRGVQAGP